VEFPWNRIGCVNVRSPKPTTLLLHDGELADVRTLLDELGARFEERSGGPTPTDPQTSWDLVIATPKRILDFISHGETGPTTRIAILASEARVLRKVMRREKIEFVVRRPVHPEALRLLILHALYRGPEKREASRVSIGATVHFRAGWVWRRALLLDLSLRGCRLQARQRLARGDRVSIRLPAKIAGRGSLGLSGRVVRRRPAGRSRQGVDVVAIHFDTTPLDVVRRLQATVNEHAWGPASLHGSTAKRFVVERLLPGTNRDGDAGVEDGMGEATSTGTSTKARGVRGDRRSLSRRVIALGEARARVLIGRDLSLGGMRVDPHPDLSPGDGLRIALHVRSGQPPLVLEAEVCRDDAERGLALRFGNLSREATSYLREMLASLPAIEAPADDRAGTASVGVVVSEILDSECA